MRDTSTDGMGKRAAGWFVILAAFLGLSVQATEHLLLVGGGTPPPEAVQRLANWAGGANATVLVIGWAGDLERKDWDTMSESLMAIGVRNLIKAPLAREMPQRRLEFLAYLKRATAVWFSGGQQDRIMDVLAKDPPLLAALRERYQQGITFGGTSAGTAIMSRTMITGDGDFEVIRPGAAKTREGLGLISDAIVDQHFIRRQRENRMFSVLLDSHETLGIGIDEGEAIAIEGGRYFEVIGPTLVMVLDTRAEPGKFTIELLKAGQTYDLFLRKSTPAPH